MSRLRPISITLLLSMLAGCGGKSLVEQEEEVFADYRTPIYTHQIPKRELGGMIDEYQKAAASQYPQIEAAARQRLADLALEASEKLLLQLNPDGMGAKDAGYYKAIGIYEQLLKDYPQSEQNDVILYHLARAYDYAGDPKKVLEALSQLASLYPHSPLYSEAQFRRGELLFTLGRFDEASVAYQTVTARGVGEPYYKHALYKQAWSLYRANRVSAAHHNFADLLDTLEAPAELERVKVGERELVGDVLRVLAISFSQQQGAESIKQFAESRNVPTYTPLIFQTLAEQYAGQRLYGEAARVYRFYSDHYADNVAAPGFQLQAIRLHERNSELSQALQTREQFVKRYGPGLAIWKSLGDERYAEFKPQIKENIIYLAKHYHAKFQSSGTVQDGRLAQYWYQHFLDSYPAEPETGNVHFLYAESLYEQGAYSQAAEAYDRAAYHYQTHEMAAEAGYAAIYTQEKRNDLNEEARQRLLISGSDKFLNYFPQDRRVNEVRHKKADQHLALKEYDLAVSELELLIAALGDSERILAATVWEKLSLSRFMLQQYSEAEKASQQALALSHSPEQQVLLRARLAAAIYKQGESAQQAGEWQRAASHFLRVASVVPGAKIIPQAEYDGATAYINSNEWREAAEVLERFVSSYRQHPLHLGAQEKLAFAYSEMGETGKAAHAYSALASMEKNLQKKRTWLSQAADLHQQEGNYVMAIQLLNQYQGLSQTKDMAYFEVALRIAEIEERNRNLEGYRQQLNQIVAQISSLSATPGLTQQAANASLALAESYHQAFQEIELVHPIKDAMGQKKAAMQKALDYYRQAADYRITTTTTAATHHIGEIYQQLSYALLHSERPKGMDSEELEMYSMMLEEQAFPFEEKAIDLYQLNILRIKDGIYDEWVRRSFKALGELQPARFDKRELTETIITSLN